MRTPAAIVAAGASLIHARLQRADDRLAWKALRDRRCLGVRGARTVEGGDVVGYGDGV